MGFFISKLSAGAGNALVNLSASYGFGVKGVGTTRSATASELRFFCWLRRRLRQRKNATIIIAMIATPAAAAPAIIPVLLFDSDGNGVEVGV